MFFERETVALTLRKLWCVNVWIELIFFTTKKESQWMMDHYSECLMVPYEILSELLKLSSNNRDQFRLRAQIWKFTCVFLCNRSSLIDGLDWVLTFLIENRSILKVNLFKTTDTDHMISIINFIKFRTSEQLKTLINPLTLYCNHFFPPFSISIC